MEDKATLLADLSFESRWLNSVGSGQILAVTNLADASSLCSLPFFFLAPQVLVFSPLLTLMYTHMAYSLWKSCVETEQFGNSNRSQTRLDEQAFFPPRKSLIVVKITTFHWVFSTPGAHNSREGAGPRTPVRRPSPWNLTSPCLT